MAVGWRFTLARPGSRQTGVLQPFPATGARYLVLAGNGGHPYWTRDGKNLIVNVSPTENRIVAVTTPAVQFGSRSRFHERGEPKPNPSFDRARRDALSDGRIIGMTSQASLTDTSRFVVVLNWFGELRRLLPAP
jgi:hypothetical protein